MPAYLPLLRFIRKSLWESYFSGKGQQLKMLAKDGNEDWRNFIFILEDRSMLTWQRRSVNSDRKVEPKEREDTSAKNEVSGIVSDGRIQSTCRKNSFRHEKRPSPPVIIDTKDRVRTGTSNMMYFVGWCVKTLIASIISVKQEIRTTADSKVREDICAVENLTIPQKKSGTCCGLLEGDL